MEAGAVQAMHGALRLSAANLVVARGKRILLSSFSVDVAAGEIVHVAGENGCGKSSLLRVLAGDVEPRSGQISRVGPFAYVPERMVLPDSLRARRWLRLYGSESTELPSELDQRCGALSKGQLQRVALTGALRANANLLILDEPWSGLDVDARVSLDTAIQEAAARGAAVVFTDHSGAGAVTASTRLVLGEGPPRREALGNAASTRRVRIVVVRGPERRDELVALELRDGHIASALADGWGIERVEAPR